MNYFELIKNEIIYIFDVLLKSKQNVKTEVRVQLRKKRALSVFIYIFCYYVLTKRQTNLFCISKETWTRIYVRFKGPESKFLKTLQSMFWSHSLLCFIPLFRLSALHIPLCLVTIATFHLLHQHLNVESTVLPWLFKEQETVSGEICARSFHYEA